MSDMSEMIIFVKSLDNKELFAIAQEAVLYNDKEMMKVCRDEMAKRKPEAKP